jgi:hypothetical protein
LECCFFIFFSQNLQVYVGNFDHEFNLTTRFNFFEFIIIHTRRKIETTYHNISKIWEYFMKNSSEIREINLFVDFLTKNRKIMDKT